jgi:hypothetical protein
MPPSTKRHWDRKSRWSYIMAGQRLESGPLSYDAVYGIAKKKNVPVLVALHPHLHRGQHPDNLFLADFHRGAVAMVRRARHPGRLD